MQKYLLRKSRLSVNIFILNNSFAKKVAVPKSNYPKETFYSHVAAARLKFRSEKLAILKKQLLQRIDCSKKEACQKKQMLWRNSCSEKVTCVEVVTPKKCEEVAFPKIKLPWKSHKKCEKRNRHLKKNPKLNYYLRLIKIIFSDRFAYHEKCSWGISYDYLSGLLEST